MAVAFKLYELSDAMNQVAQMIEDGVELESLQETLESIEISFQEKAESIIKLHRSKVAEMEIIKAERLRLEHREASLKKSADWLRNYVESQMKRTGVTKIPSTLFGITLANNPVKVDITDEFMIPDQYFRISEVKAPDKAAIKAALEDGVDIQGARLVREQSLRIK
ncbi:MAG: hypothetical protein K0Q73_7203 [Paenibacillus sp.]|nr:hypothetical protein [Paenibacillus sp.]